MGNSPSKKTILYYHGACKKFYARSLPIILTLEQAKIDYEVKEPQDAPQGTGFAVPMIKLSNGQYISQTIAILNALGEEHGLHGKTVEEQNLCLQTLLDLNDIATELKGGTFTDNPDRLKKWMGILELRLKDKTYFGGAAPTTADFYAFFVFTFLDGRMGPAYRESFPKIGKWVEDVKKVPVVKTLMEDSISLTPPSFPKK